MIHLIILCLFTYCSSFVPLKENNFSSCENVDQTETYERKGKNNIYRAYNDMSVSIYGFDDLCSYTLIENLINDNWLEYQPSRITVGNTQTIHPFYDLYFNTGKMDFYNGTSTASVNLITAYVTYYSLTETSNMFGNAYELVYQFNYSFGGNVGTFVKRASCTFYNSPFSYYGGFTINKIYGDTGNNYYFYTSNSYVKNLVEPRNNENLAYQQGYQNGKNDGFDEGYDNGYDEGVERGKEIASDPASDIYENTFNAGKQTGYTEGYQSAIEQGTTAATIFTGVVEVGLLPVNVFLKMFEYEVFGINIAGLVSGFLTIAIVVIVVRIITGKKND